MSSFLSSTPGDIHSFSVAAAQTLIQKALDAAPTTASPDPALVAAATASLPSSLPESGLGDEATFTHLLRDLAPGFNGSKLSANYYGFITGGVLPIAEAAENVVTAWDQNVQVHLPTFSVCTAVEDAALSMLGELVELQGWTGRTFTTGATGSNVLGLACGREAVVAHKLRKVGIEEGVAELGMLGACQEAGIREIQVLTSMGHSSLYKAASIVGLGRRNVREVGGEGEPWKVDLEKLEKGLQKEKTASIVVISCGEVNTGRFATAGLEEVQVIRDLCDKYEAWLHVDGAFGLWSRVLPNTPEFAYLRTASAGMELADSITGDCHKGLNVPYDCGFFFTRSAATLPVVFQNANAVYLSASPTSIPSALNSNLENSRRFRALPVYAVLLAHGRKGVSEMMARQVRLARLIAQFISESEHYELLPKSTGEVDFRETGIMVLFRATAEKINEVLVDRINNSRTVYMSGTQWEGRTAVRIAVSNWKVEETRDVEIVKEILMDLLEES